MNPAKDFPIIPHHRTRANCCGCIVPDGFRGDYVRLRCNQCGKEFGTIRWDILIGLAALINQGL